MNSMMNLNKNASIEIGDSPKVRVRVIGPLTGALQIRPTDRKSAAGLPKGEVLIDLQKRTDRGTLRFKLPAEILDATFLNAGDQVKMIASKHGWMTLVKIGDEVGNAIPSKIGVPAPAGGSITAK